MLDPERGEAFLAWLDGVLAIKGSLPPDGLTIRAELGPDSIALSNALRFSEPAFFTHSAHSLMPWYCDTAISCTILVSPNLFCQAARNCLFAGNVDSWL